MMLTAKAALPISPRTVLVDVTFLRAAHGINTRKVTELIESGSILWAFDLGRSAKESKPRHFRVWIEEVLDAQAVAGLALEQVINRILPPNRQFFNGAEISQWLMISKPTVKRVALELAGKMNQRVWQIERQALAGFLAKRWIGASKMGAKP
jgi:hypothetical protein